MMRLLIWLNILSHKIVLIWKKRRLIIYSVHHFLLFCRILNQNVVILHRIQLIITTVSSVFQRSFNTIQSWLLSQNHIGIDMSVISTVDLRELVLDIGKCSFFILLLRFELWIRDISVFTYLSSSVTISSGLLHLLILFNLLILQIAILNNLLIVIIHQNFLTWFVRIFLSYGHWRCNVRIVIIHDRLKTTT